MWVPPPHPAGFPQGYDHVAHIKISFCFAECLAGSLNSGYSPAQAWPEISEGQRRRLSRKGGIDGSHVCVEGVWSGEVGL